MKAGPLSGLPPYCRVVAITSLAIGVLFAAGLLRAFLSTGIPQGLADKDFANYWMAGQLVMHGQTMDLFGPQPVYFARLTAAFGADYPWHNWSYPPHALLLFWPLGLFGYKAAMVIFLAATGAFFIWAFRQFVGAKPSIAWVAVLPFIVHNFAVVQNGYLSAALALGALGLREKRPVIAGILLGLLTVKPQLGFLFPFLLLAERRWAVMASAIATTVVLVAASAAIFGVDAWRGYIAEVLPYQTLVMRYLEGTFLAMMPSFYGALRNWNVGVDLALLVHCAVAVPVAAIAIVAFFRLENGRDRSIILLVATFVVTPYALSYDLGMFAGALALLVSRGREDGQQGKAASILLAVAMLLPLVTIAFGEMKISFAPFAILAVFVFALQETGLITLPSSRRTRADSTAEQSVA